MFEAFRDETYGRRNLATLAVVALLAIGGPGLLWALFGPGVFVAIAGVAGFALVFGSIGAFWMAPMGGVVPGDNEREPRRRRRQ
ncbi:MAG: hypothetical protein U5Q44_08210 [Dehalococcoidia bacterium]|nr:hypothetical protein [Dehalococcoidia bacterium]